jgi:hypothetical protein
MRVVTGADLASVERMKRRWLSGKDQSDLATFMRYVRLVGTKVEGRDLAAALAAGHDGGAVVRAASEFALARRRLPIARRRPGGNRRSRRRTSARSRSRAPDRPDDAEPPLDAWTAR